MAEYIEREAVVHHFMTKRQYLTKDLVMDAAYEVSKFPAADVAPVVHGRWEFIADECCSTAHCSNCGKGQGLYINGRKPEWNYCPNCGAHMKDGDG